MALVGCLVGSIAFEGSVRLCGGRSRAARVVVWTAVVRRDCAMSDRHFGGLHTHGWRAESVPGEVSESSALQRTVYGCLFNFSNVHLVIEVLRGRLQKTMTW